MVYATRLPVSTEALINWGQARAFVSLGQKQRYMVNFYWRWLAASWGSEMMFLSLEQYKSTDKNIWFQYIKSFSIFLSALLLCFSAPCLLLILQKKHKKKSYMCRHSSCSFSWESFREHKLNTANFLSYWQRDFTLNFQLAAFTSAISHSPERLSLSAACDAHQPHRDQFDSDDRHVGWIHQMQLVMTAKGNWYLVSFTYGAGGDVTPSGAREFGCCVWAETLKTGGVCVCGRR